MPTRRDGNHRPRWPWGARHAGEVSSPPVLGGGGVSAGSFEPCLLAAGRGGPSDKPETGNSTPIPLTEIEP